LTSLGWPRGCCAVNRPERIISRYDQVSGHHFGVWFG